MELHVFKNLELLSRSLADYLVADIQETLQEQSRYCLVLSGGSTPKALYKLLASSPWKEKIDWSKIYFFLGDERYVPYEDDRHNGKMAYEALLDHVPVKQENVFLMDTSIPPEEAAVQYEEKLHSLFEGADATFDLVLLGMGDDGHTLSLFPGTAIVHEKEKWVAAPFVQAQDMYRITLTQPVVSKSKSIVFLAAGAKKATTLQQVLEGDYQPDRYPSQVINKSEGKVQWFVDEAAAARLRKE